MMRVVVVGGTGNISTGIVKSLLSLGHEVTVFTRGQRESRLPDGVRYLTGDRKDRAGFEAMMQAERFDAAIDMICYTAEDAASTLRAFRGVKHLIHCSTVCTYGGPLPFVPANEETPLRPITDYGRHKVAADEILLGQTEIPVTIFKPAHTFGPTWIVLRQLGFDPAWIDRLRKGKPIIVSGDGQNLWSWCHSDDAGVGFAHAVGREKCFGQIYNITRPDYLTWQEYHERVAAALNLPITIVHVPAETILASPLGKKAGLLASQARWNQAYDVSKLQRDIPEFQPKVSLEDGVRECVANMDRRGTMGNSDEDDTEDRLIAAQRRVSSEQ
jgi:nucleoside-diphosphate-sugar epimerase